MPEKLDDLIVAEQERLQLYKVATNISKNIDVTIISHVCVRNGIPVVRVLGGAGFSYVEKTSDLKKLGE